MDKAWQPDTKYESIGAITRDSSRYFITGSAFTWSNSLVEYEATALVDDMMLAKNLHLEDVFKATQKN